MTHSVTISARTADLTESPIKVGLKIRLKETSEFMYPQRIKNKKAIYRLFKKRFVPYFIVTATLPVENYQFRFQIKPFNF